MLPMDLNFVVQCGIATIAATVGYACVRKSRPLPSRGVRQQRGDSTSDATATMVDVSTLVPEKSTTDLDPNDENTLSDLESETTVAGENLSLKRKRSHDQEENDPDMGYPHNLNSIYPNKRRSGSVSDTEPNENPNEITAERCDSPQTEEPPPAAESGPSDLVPSVPTQADVPEDTSSSDPTPVCAEMPATAIDTVASDSVSSIPTKLDVPEETPSSEVPKPTPIFADMPRFVFPKTPPPIARFHSTASPGFANFAGSSSPFLSLGSLDSGPVSGKPIWANTTDAPILEPSLATADAEPEAKNDLLPALGTPKAPAPALPTQLTGEEEEDVILELKGAKLFIKRGEDNFSGGMIGHIKLLSHKTTLTKRLLFRREPLWKVSMNVRMQPTVRCTFDAQENILRVALKELSDSLTPQTVIYAFKPSRSCRKSDFQDFSESLLAQARQGVF